MYVRPSWRGLAGVSTAVLISLPMQNDRDPAPPPLQAPAVAAPPREVTLPPLLAGTFVATVRAWEAAAAHARLPHEDAADLLLGAGVRRKSSGGCADRDRPRCTSLQAIRYGTLRRVIDLRRASGCPVTITGGTEHGHAAGRYSHGNGYKVDLAHNPCLDAYVTRTGRHWRERADGATLYRAAPSDVWADEPTHWDVLFR
ncbi:hypothetical protein [Microbispora sp. H11081]|uniref:hypothetical protein n=1 Tax=Microbispora sp. H11081 TaxID=2729107 RepID=UPI001474F6BF|nr:hypothetical protein [Microbispora sp. H11081]